MNRLLTPLIKAIQHDKRLENPMGIKLDECVSHVMESSVKIMSSGCSENASELSGSDVEGLLYVLSQTLSNEIILYRNDRLDIFIDEFVSLYSSQNKFIKDSIIQNNKPLKELDIESNTKINTVLLSALMEVYQPIWFFHTNLYVSGFTDLAGLLKLNGLVSTYVTRLLVAVNHEVKGEKYSEVSHFYNSAKLYAIDLDGLQTKVVKKKSDINEYITDPIKYLDKTKEAFFANFSSLSKETTKLIAAVELT
ncbi:MAG: hypothetical protein HAW67_02310, partial [Endozoicomonadaceae bacterium]|nr:hypothetical protein [Endozoicomonadaceae bacterium]